MYRQNGSRTPLDPGAVLQGPQGAQSEHLGQAERGEGAPIKEVSAEQSWGQGEWLRYKTPHRYVHSSM